MHEHLLIVEDDAALNYTLGAYFEERGFRISQALSVAEAWRRVLSAAPNAVLLDQQLPDGAGLDLLQPLREREPDLPVIMITALNDLELAIRAIQQGAYDYIHKPIQIQELEHVIQRALEHQRLARKLTALRSSAAQPAEPVGEMIGQSRAMIAISKEIALVAQSPARVLITGESGVGKEVVARAIHAHSGREGPFLAVNCAAIVDTLLESELFGHEKGAFTGAVSRKPGKFELAGDGVLFLDEVGELAPLLQAKLLRVLQEGVFERVGGTQQIATQARVIAATNRDLEAEVKAGRFRSDLLYRLKVFTIHIPPLRERREDIPLLVERLLKQLASALHRPPLPLTAAAQARLVEYDWPGNVRELISTLTQALIRARSPVLTPELLALPEKPTPSAPEPPAQDPFRAPSGRLLSLEELEALHVQRVLQETQGHKGQACDLLGISRPALERKIEKYRVQLPEKRTNSS